MKEEVPFGGVGGGRAGVCSSLQGQAVLLIPLWDRAPACESLRWCRGAVQLQQACRCSVQLHAIPHPVLFPGEGSSWEQAACLLCGSLLSSWDAEREQATCQTSPPFNSACHGKMTGWGEGSTAVMRHCSLPFPL